MCIIALNLNTTNSVGSTITAANGQYRLQNSTTWGNSFVINLLNPRTPNITTLGTYELRVNVVDSNGSVSQWSNTSIFTVSNNCGSTVVVSAACVSNQTYIKFSGGSHLRYPVNTYTEPAFNLSKIQCGTKIRLYINFSASGSIAYNATYDKTFTATKDYTTVKAWYDAEVINLGTFGTSYTRGSGFNTDGSKYYVRAHRNGTASRNIGTVVTLEFGL